MSTAVILFSIGTVMYVLAGGNLKPLLVFLAISLVAGIRSTQIEELKIQLRAFEGGRHGGGRPGLKTRPYRVALTGSGGSVLHGDGANFVASGSRRKLVLV